MRLIAQDHNCATMHDGGRTVGWAQFDAPLTTIPPGCHPVEGYPCEVWVTEPTPETPIPALPGNGITYSYNQGTLKVIDAEMQEVATYALS